ncbi:hypothetical protein ACYPKM_02150 [Pseudomonas aeruginosa]
MRYVIFSNAVYDADAPISARPIARFSSHLAAFDAVQRLKDPNWRPLGHQPMTEADFREFERIGGTVKHRS